MQRKKAAKFEKIMHDLKFSLLSILLPLRVLRDKSPDLEHIAVLTASFGDKLVELSRIFPQVPYFAVDTRVLERIASFNLDERFGEALRNALTGIFKNIVYIDRGATSYVYGGETYDGQRVALKISNKSFFKGDEDLAVFNREAAILMNLDHPNIQRLMMSFEVGFGNNTFPVLALEYIDRPEGEGHSWNLRDVIAYCEKRGRKVPLQVVEVIAFLLVRALRYLHQQNILHRDIKPENVMVSGKIGTAIKRYAHGMSAEKLFTDVLEDPAGVKLLDFGLASAYLSEDEDLQQMAGNYSIGPSQQNRKKLLGTPGFISPEQITVSRAPMNLKTLMAERDNPDEDVSRGTKMTDLFALGVTLAHFILSSDPLHFASIPFPHRAKEREKYLLAFNKYVSAEGNLLSPEIMKWVQLQFTDRYLFVLLIRHLTCAKPAERISVDEMLSAIYNMLKDYLSKREFTFLTRLLTPDEIEFIAPIAIGGALERRGGRGPDFVTAESFGVLSNSVKLLKEDLDIKTTTVRALQAKNEALAEDLKAMKQTVKLLVGLFFVILVVNGVMMIVNSTGS
ncbi:MAG: protein kinase [Planctomycetota bacterium]|nr:protein kinase [Planctomycetota bacterium]